MTMRFMTTYNFGDVVLVGFPFTDLQSTKKRPGAIISSAHYKKSRTDVILLAITSHVQQPLQSGDVLIEHWQAAGLAKPSIFKPLIATN